MRKIAPLLLLCSVASLYATTGTLNKDVQIRETPSMKGKVVGITTKGSSFEILQKVDGGRYGYWYQTPKGYIYETFITLDTLLQEEKEEQKTTQPLQIETLKYRAETLIEEQVEKIKEEEKKQVIDENISKQDESPLVSISEKATDETIIPVAQEEFLSHKPNSTEEFIEDFVAEAIKNNPSILSKQNAIKYAKFLQESASWEYFPTSIANSELIDTGERVYNLGLKQPLYSGGKIDAQYEIAKLKVKINAMSSKEVEQTLALSITQAIYMTINAHAKMLVYQDFLVLMEQSKEMMQRRIEHGVSPESDLMLVESRLANLKTDYNLAVVSQKKALATLSQFLARDVKLDEFTAILPQTKCSIQFDRYKQLEGFVDESIKTSPAVEKYDYQIETQKREVDLKVASFYPSVYAQMTREKQVGSEYETVSKVVIEMNLGAGLSSFSNLEAARVNIEGSIDDKNSYLLELTQKLESEKIDYELALERYEYYVISADNAGETVKSYERLFKVGKKSWLDVLNTQREWANADLALTDAQSYLLITPFKFKIYSNQLVGH